MSSSSSLSSSDVSHHHQGPHNNKLGLALFACLQNALVGGIVFGWASIDRTMLQASEEDGGANLTATQTTQLFTYASSTAMLSSLFLGPILDAGGPRVCLTVSHFLVMVGCGGFALSHAEWQFALAVISMAFGGPGIGLSIIHVANLFPHNQFLAVSILAGSITLSFSMLAVLNVLWEHYGLGFRVLFGAYSLVVAASMTGTLLVSPDEPYELDDDDDSISEEEDNNLLLHHNDNNLLLHHNDEAHPTLEQEYVEATIHTYAHHHQHPLLLTDQPLADTLRKDIDQEEDDEGHHHHHHHHHHHTLNKTHSFYQSQEAVQSGNETAVKLMSLKDQPFSVQLQSPTFARAVLIFIITSFLANFTIAALSTELEDLAAQFDSLQRHDLSQQFTWLLSVGLLYAVLVGWLMDRMGLELCTLLTLILGQVSTLFMLLGGSHWLSGATAYTSMVVGFALYSLFRQFLFPVFLAYVSDRLGFKYFGILSGIGFALSGIAQCFMAQLVAFVHDSKAMGWMEFHVFQIVLMAVLMVIPIADHRDIQRREAQMEQALKSLHPQRVSGNKSPRSTHTASTTTTAASPLWKQRQEMEDVEYGSLQDNSR